MLVKFIKKQYTIYLIHKDQGILDKIKSNPKPKNIKIDLNLDWLESAFLCLDQPIVIKVIAIILVSGCSNEVNLAVFSMFPKSAKPLGKNKI